MHFRRHIAISGALVAVILTGCASPERRRTESIRCGNYMVSIGYTALIWADDRDGYLPSDILSMTTELGTPRILHCPGDHSRHVAANWASFTLSQSSYEIVTAHLRVGDTNGVFLRCKVHGHLGYADATVFDGVRRRSKLRAP